MELRTLLLLAAAGCALSACDQAKEAIGLGKHPPDEFQVVAQAPLSMPPDYNLPTPTPGAPRPQQGTAQNEAENALLANTSGAAGGTFAGTTADTTQSSGEEALLQTAGASSPDPKIRTMVDQEAAADAAASEDLMDRLAFWRTPEPTGTIVDPQAEQQRLQQNAALGQPVTTGATPTIKRKKKALLEGIF